MAICRLYIQSGLKFTTREFDIEIWEIDTFFTELISKLDIRIKNIKFHHKLFETFFTMSPYKENIINVPKPHKRLKLLSMQELTFHLIHKYIYICIYIYIFIYIYTYKFTSECHSQTTPSSEWR